MQNNKIMIVVFTVLVQDHHGDAQAFPGCDSLIHGVIQPGREEPAMLHLKSESVMVDIGDITTGAAGNWNALSPESFSDLSLRSFPAWHGRVLAAKAPH
ncbi:MAG: hypothetical protein C4321_00330 [Chloroflexota bacterium]